MLEYLSPNFFVCLSGLLSEGLESLQNFEINLSHVIARHQTRLRIFQLETSFSFARINLKPVALKNFVFDWELCFRLCEIYRFQNLVGLELPIKRTLKSLQRFEPSPVLVEIFKVL